MGRGDFTHRDPMFSKLRYLFPRRLSQRDSVEAGHIETINQLAEKMDLSLNEKAVAEMILRHDIGQIVHDILDGRGSVGEQGFVGLCFPNPEDPHDDDFRGVEFYYGDQPSTYMEAERFIAFLQAMNDVAAPEQRAPAAQMHGLRAALARIALH